MKKIAVILENWFEDIEFTAPVDAFKEKGHQIIVIGLQAGKTLKGKKQGIEVQTNKSFDEVLVSDFDALLIPGGYSPDKLRADSKAVEFTKNFTESGKPVFSICHGPQLLISADVLKGKKIAGWKSIIQDIKNAGAELVDEKVVVDGNIVSSRNPDDLPAFIQASLQKLEKEV